MHLTAYQLSQYADGQSNEPDSIKRHLEICETCFSDYIELIELKHHSRTPPEASTVESILKEVRTRHTFIHIRATNGVIEFFDRSGVKIEGSSLREGITGLDARSIILNGITMFVQIDRGRFRLGLIYSLSISVACFQNHEPIEELQMPDLFFRTPFTSGAFSFEFRDSEQQPVHHLTIQFRMNPTEPIPQPG